MNITKSNLSPISKVDLAYFEEKYKVQNIAIHRGTLQQLLIDQLKSTEINLDHQLNSLDQSENGFTLNFKNGKTHQSSILIGADGIKSKVRQNLFPENEIRNANQVCWRGITNFDLPFEYKHELNEVWGKTARFGFVQIAENKVYWYALKSFKKDQNEVSVNHIEEYFRGYNVLIQNIIKSTKKEAINTAEISDLKPTNQWYTENVCLIGDAAHATTPNLGQGACQAIEDAYVLSECLAKHETNTAFKEFQKLRISKAHQVVKTSWMIGKMSHVSNPILAGLRNQMMRLTPASIMRKQSEQIFELTRF